MIENKENCGSCNEEKPKHYNKGINCDAKNCVYNDCACYCTADMINVGPRNATCSSDTVCATFKERK